MMKSVAHLDSAPHDEGFVLVGKISEFPTVTEADEGDESVQEVLDDEDSYDYCEDALSTSSQIHQTITSTSNPMQSVQENFFVENGPADKPSLLLAESNSSLIPAEEDDDEGGSEIEPKVNFEGVPTSILTVNFLSEDCEDFVEPLDPPLEHNSHLVDAAPSEIDAASEHELIETLAEADAVIEDDLILKALSNVDVAVLHSGAPSTMSDHPALENHKASSGSTTMENQTTDASSSDTVDKAEVETVVPVVANAKEDKTPAKPALCFPKTTNRKKRRKQLKLAKKAAAAAAGYAALNLRGGSPPGTPSRGQKRKGKSKKVANIAVSEALKTHGEYQQQMVHLLT